jgi:thiamine-phosphate pyrophosphorylase
MKLALISPPDEQACEIATVEALFLAGLERFHLRKPDWSEERVACWLAALPLRFHHRVHLHSHHGLATRLAIGGIHFRDEDSMGAPVPSSCATGRSCHDPNAVKTRLGQFDALFFGPVFPSLSKPGYGPVSKTTREELRAVLANRDRAQKRTCVFAVGGITPEHVEGCRALGFDGVAILGALWNATQPLAVFKQFLLAAKRRSDPVVPYLEGQP